MLTIVVRQIMGNHGSIARSGNNDHEYFSLLHNASMARYSSSRVITAAPRCIHAAIRTRRCASHAHRCIQHWNRSLETEHIRFLSPHNFSSISFPKSSFVRKRWSFLSLSIHFITDEITHILFNLFFLDKRMRIFLKKKTQRSENSSGKKFWIFSS